MSELMGDHLLDVREAAARVKIGKTALYEALRAEKATTSAVKPT